MEVIEGMSSNEYDTVCSTGAELVDELTELVRRRGLEPQQAFNVLVVAAAGVAAASGLSSEDLARGVDSVGHMWDVHDGPHGRTAIFVPTTVACLDGTMGN